MAPPRKFTVEQMQERVDAYIARFVDPTAAAYEPKFVPTINGISLWLGVSKDTLYNYRKRVEFADMFEPVMRALESWWEAKLASSSPVGAIFWLKNRPDRDWNDRTMQDVNHTMAALTDEQLDARIMALMQNVPMMQTIAAVAAVPDKPTEH